MQRQILVPLDGSALAERILPHAEVLARVTGSALTLLQVLPAPLAVNGVLGAAPGIMLTAQQIQAEEDAAAYYLAALAGRLERVTGGALRVHTAVVAGDPAGTIVDWAAQDPSMRMVAMATHGRSGMGRWVFGSVAEKVLHAVATPLLLVRAREPRESPPAQSYHTIVVPLDGSPLAEQALGQVLPLAKASQAKLILVTVAPTPEAEEPTGLTELAWAPSARQETSDHLACYLDQTAARLRATGVHVETRLIHGHPAEGILCLSNEVRADLIAMSTHGRGGLQRLWLGSIAMKVVQGAYRPVLLVRASAPPQAH